MTKRDHRAAEAQRTLDIIQAGEYYTLPSDPSRRKRVELPTLAAMRQQTRLFTPEQGDELHAALQARQGTFQTACEVTPETTFGAARRLRTGAQAVAALNFASAKNRGGGFLGGAQAQEEDLCRSSALYASLTTPQVGDYYDANRQCGTALYTHHLIYSPAVPIFRDETGKLLEVPVTVNILTAPAPNAGAVAHNRPEEGPQVLPTLRERAVRVLGSAALTGQTHLVLGAWGCGVFRNDPAEVARIFRELLDGEAQGAFAQVTFAIYDRSRDKATLGAFEAAF